MNKALVIITTILQLASLDCISAQFAPEECSQFAELAFDIRNYERYPEYFREDTTITLAEAGEYAGIDGIQEYVRFADIDSPYVKNYESPVPPQFSLKTMNPTTGTCVFNILSTRKYTTDPTTTREAEYYVSAITKLFYELSDNKISKMYVYYTPEQNKWFFNTALGTPKTSAFICDLFTTKCATALMTRNGNADVSSCQSQFSALPLLSGTNFDGRDQGCRKLHAAFAGVNDLHCAHISFTPTADANGDIKCQESSNNTASEFFDDEDLIKFQEYVTAPDSLVGSSTGFKIIRLAQEETPAPTVASTLNGSTSGSRATKFLPVMATCILSFIHFFAAF